MSFLFSTFHPPQGQHAFDHDPQLSIGYIPGTNGIGGTIRGTDAAPCTDGRINPYMSVFDLVYDLWGTCFANIHTGIAHPASVGIYLPGILF
jgi:hypothetical protein